MLLENEVSSDKSWQPPKRFPVLGFVGTLTPMHVQALKLPLICSTAPIWPAQINHWQKLCKREHLNCITNCWGREEDKLKQGLMVATSLVGRG